MWYLTRGIFAWGLKNLAANWEVSRSPVDEDIAQKGVRVGFVLGLSNRPLRQDALASVRRWLGENPVSWISVRGQKCVFDLERLRESFPDLAPETWLRDTAMVEPDVES